MRLVPRSVRRLIGDAAMLAAILTFFVTLIASWGALEPVFRSVSQWIASVAGVNWGILLQLIRIGMAGYLAYRLSRLVRNELDAMQSQIDSHWLDNMEAHAQTTDALGRVSRDMFAGNRGRHIDVVRLAVENQLQLILVVGFAARAARATLLEDIAARREMYEQTLTDDDAKAAALEVVTRYQNLLGANVLDE